MTKILFVTLLLSSIYSSASVFSKCYSLPTVEWTTVVPSETSFKDNCPAEVSVTTPVGPKDNEEIQITYGALAMAIKAAPKSGEKDKCFYNIWGGRSVNGVIRFGLLTCEK